MSYLLGITIGPVQTYIEESRKLSDLCNSSRIISDIMIKIKEYIEDLSERSEIIYPNHNRDEFEKQTGDFSNYMVVEIKDIIDMKNIQEKIYGENEREFKEIFHLFWGIQEIGKDGYLIAYKKLVELINSIKNTYEFEQIIQEGNKKCSICGKRDIANISHCKRKQFKLIEDEDLCSVCLLKRKSVGASSKTKFKSIYEVAIKKWVKSCGADLRGITEDLSEIFQENAKYYNKNEISNSIKTLEEITKYLDETFKEKASIYNEFTMSNITKLLEGNNDINALKKSKDIKTLKILKKLKKINQELKDKNEDENELELDKLIKKLKTIEETMKNIYKKRENPNYEYCFIQFDIDNLGRWMSGEYLEDKEKLKDYQISISNMLVEFGEELRKALNNNDCDIIYSGGDDFLAALPNEEIRRVIETIDNVFEREVQSKMQKHENIDKNMTYSTSITIAQCKDPMNYAIRKSRLELENVKNRFKRNGIPKNGVVLNYIINNGKEITSYLKKDQFNTLMKLVEKFKIMKSDISFAYINNFEKEFLKFNYQNITFEDLRYLCVIVKYELKRLMNRSKIVKDENVKTEELNIYINEIIDFITEVINKNYEKLKPNSYDVDFKNVMNIIKIYEKLSKINFNNEGGMIQNGID
ncbi:Cas10/Cmr2 second palm domain-containing protein [Clostridium tagluense]|uniref:Cas10/Cmr2 second palm domain-containing protein n=1 Tax=Clostridium tagluense TaxID=360422 RepID=UPI001C0D85AB|nr:type III-B CRISPR-associated protein Cas10/Cmr2 [Clostridium tagluense]MBU3127895.1 hypothetical protein [Clostridium tagluense]